MKKRIFLCTSVNFPRSGASANYIQYLALALKEEDWDVLLLGKGRNRPQDYNDDKQIYEYRGIEYCNVSCENSGNHYSNSEYIKNFSHVLNDYRINEEDYAIIYTTNLKLIQCVSRFIQKDHLSICIVEWFQPSQFRLNVFSPAYLRHRFGFKYIRSNIHKIFPISQILADYFRSSGCSTLVLPAMADPYEYEYMPTEFDRHKVRFIYSGNKVTDREDAVEAMLKAFLRIERVERKRIEFHITGLTRERILQILHGDRNLLNELEQILIIHPWLDYEDLVKLYLQMDYLFLARYNNKITRANFPSKVPEILCYGVIPICSDVGDYTKKYLRNGIDSIILEGCSTEECEKAIRFALNMKRKDKERFRLDCRSSAVQNFYYKNWSGRITDFITNKLEVN